jgi:hypothetical protein
VRYAQHIAHGFRLAHPHQGMIRRLDGAQNTIQHFLHALGIGLIAGMGVLRLLQLGRGHHFHGGRDLAGILQRLDAQTQFFGAGHG